VRHRISKTYLDTKSLEGERVVLLEDSVKCGHFGGVCLKIFSFLGWRGCFENITAVNPIEQEIA
jgi:hypothetical protein